MSKSRYELESFFDVDGDHDYIEDSALTPHWNLPPTELVPGARVGRDGAMRLDAYRWGFIPNWTRNISEFKLTTINARVESVATAKTYAAAFRTKRLLVAADSFFEWDRTDPKNKQPYVFVRNDRQPMAFAGLWDSYLHPDQSEGERWVKTCTILTSAANEDMPIHDRIPVILERESWDHWLDRNVTDIDELEGIVRGIEPGVLRNYPVDKKVGSVKNDDPSCVDAIDLTLGRLF